MISKYFKKIIVLIGLFSLILVSTYSVFASTNEPNLTAKGAILLDTKTGKVLYNKNENERMYPASTTKILTAILTLENCKLDDVVTIDYDIDATIPYSYTIVELQLGEQFTVKQLLELLMVYSANDVANLLAEHIGGSIDGFANMMNEKIAELGLSNTHFTNPSGIHDDNHYTTAKDLAMIMQYCISNENFIKFSSMSSCNIPATNKHGPRNYTSTDRLLVKNDSNYYKYLICGKTGYTDKAGECLVSYASKDNLNLIGVVLGGETINGVSTRYAETKSLYEYGYDNYSIKTILDMNDVVTQIQVRNGAINEKNLDLLSNNSINALLKNSESNDNFDYTINLNNNIKAPIKQGDVLGTASYMIDGNEYKTELIASHSVEKTKFPYYLIEIFIGLILIIMFYLILSNKKINKKHKRRYK